MAYPTLNLSNINFAPIEFKPIQYQKQAIDYRLLRDSLAQREARKERALDRRDKIDETLGEIETKLNPNELEWFNNYKNNIRSQINNQIEAGNYGTSISLASRLAGDTATDTAILGRKRANEEYQNNVKVQKARMLQGELDEDTYRWWLNNNPYEYTDEYDANGNIVGGNLKEMSIPYDSTNWSDIALQGFKLINPDTITEQNSRSNSGITEDGTSRYSTGRGYSHGQTQVTEQEIIDSIYNYIDSNGLQNQIDQDYDVKRAEYERLREELNRTDLDEKTRADIQSKLARRGKLMEQNGFTVDRQTYIDRQIRQHAKSLAYNKESTTNEKSDTSLPVSVGNTPTNSRGNSGGGYDGGNNLDNWWEPRDNYEGPKREGIKGENAPNLGNINTQANGIDELLK